jgi:hypothetical protein
MADNVNRMFAPPTIIELQGEKKTIDL